MLIAIAVPGHIGVVVAVPYRVAVIALLPDHGPKLRSG